jgi:hypothetical protein
MRKRLAILLALSLSTVMAYGIIGTGATFTASAGASQTLTVGQMTLKISSTTAGAYWDGPTLVCPAYHIVTASGPYGSDPACDIKIESVGDIAPSQVNVLMTATTDGSHLARYSVAPVGIHLGDGPLPGSDGPAFTLATSSQQIGYAFGVELPKVVSLPLSWGEYAGPDALDNADMGTTVIVSYSFQAFGG